MAIRVLLVDDHEIVRRGLRSLFENTDIQVAAEAGTGQDALRLVKDKRLDLVVLDVRLPDMDGLNVLNRIKLDYPDLPVLMISSYDNPTYIARAAALGAAGYLAKDADRSTFVDAIRSASKGGNVWTREELRRVTGALMPGRLTPENEVPLTPRESEVLKQLALGLTNKEIAQTLHISYETVKEHVQHILRKIGVTDRTQAAVWAVRKQLA